MSGQINKFLQYIQYEKNFSSHTVLSYRTDLNQWCQYLGVEPTKFCADTITSQDIQHWILSLMDAGISARSISRKISTLKSFWRYLNRMQITSTNPTLKIILPKTKNTLPAFFKQDELVAALDENNTSNKFEDVRDRLIIDVFYQTGLRESELISLTDLSVDEKRSVLKVVGKRNKERIIPLGKALLQSIHSYQQLRDKEIEPLCDSLFVRRSGLSLYPKAVYNIVHSKMSMVSTLHKQSPHVLRHTFATTLMNNGADINAVKELLGHSSLGATQVYTHVNFSELTNIYKQAHPRAEKKGGKI